MFLGRITESAPAKTLNDKELDLVRRAQIGDASAFAELVTEHRASQNATTRSRYRELW